MAQDLSKSLASLEDPFLRRSVKTALHVRRFLPFYVFGTVWAVTLALFPSIGPGGGDDDDLFAGTADTGAVSADAGTGLTETGTAATDATGAATDAAAGATAGAGGTGTRTTGGATGAKVTAGAGTAAGAGAAQQASGPISQEVASSAIQRGTGRTRLDVECKPDQPQIPNSSYAIPCQNVYDGPNGGATYRGVTDKEILIVRRGFPESANSQAVAAVVEQAGGASEEESDMVRDAFIAYFNKSFELYGRTVKWVEYETKNSANATEEAQSKGKEKACLDAEDIKSMGAFGVAINGGSAPFSECAAERQIMVFDAAAYYPERFFKKYHPFLWGGPMECERISYQLSEYIGKRLINKPAKWAGDAVTRAKKRYFGTYVPDNDGYQFCVSITKRVLKEKYGVQDTGPQYNYQLDVSRFPDQAAQATVQFAAAGVTTLILACDAISAIVLTEAATKQQWNPEWMTIGTGLTDLDNAARLYDQVQVDGHLFGMSQLGSTDKLIGPTSEPGVIYKQATGKTIPDGTAGDYFGLIRLYSMLQAAGPNLTPAAVAAGARTIPPGGAPTFPAGYTSFQDGPDGTPGAGDHTAVDDSREVFWVNGTGNKSSDKGACTKHQDPYYNAPDGCAGTYKETYNGKRFRNGEWPEEDPPLYPRNT